MHQYAGRRWLSLVEVPLSKRYTGLRRNTTTPHGVVTQDSGDSLCSSPRAVYNPLRTLHACDAVVDILVIVLTIESNVGLQERLVTLLVVL